MKIEERTTEDYDSEYPKRIVSLVGSMVRLIHSEGLEIIGEVWDILDINNVETWIIIKRDDDKMEGIPVKKVEYIEFLNVKNEESLEKDDVMVS